MVVNHKGVKQFFRVPLFACAVIFSVFQRSVPADSPSEEKVSTTAKQKASMASAEKEGAVVEASIPTNCKRGQPAQMSVVIRNNGENPFYCCEMDGVPHRDMEMELQNRDTNTAVELTATGKDTLSRIKEGGSMGLIRLDKGGERASKIDLSEFFVLQHGHFKFTATFRLNRSPTKAGQEPYIKVVIHDLDFTVAD